MPTGAIMTAATFDMFDFVTELVESGIPEKQANAYAKAHNKVQRSHDEKLIETVIEKVKHDYKLDEVTTKHDLRELELTLTAQIKETEYKIELLRSELRHDVDNVRIAIEKTRADLIMWFVGTAFTMAGFIFMLIRLKFLIIPD
jgi:hypothetical protein